MKWVKIIKRDFAQPKNNRVIATCVLGENGRVNIECEDEYLLIRLRRGMYSPRLNEFVIPDQGEDFLEALGYEFKSLDLIATDVMEGEDIE